MERSHKMQFWKSSPWQTNLCSNIFGVGVWGTIRDLWPKLEINLQVKVGNGRKTKFWKDTWNDQTPLMDSFPDLFTLCNNPEANINDCWTAQGWNLSFRRFLNDWKVKRMANLLNGINEFKGINSEPDTLRWKHSKDGECTVNRACKKENMVKNEVYRRAWKNIWKSSAQTEVKCFIQLVAKRACLTHEVLKRKGTIIVSRCFLCKETDETNSHLFLHCKFTTQI